MHTVLLPPLASSQEMLVKPWTAVIRFYPHFDPVVTPEAAGQFVMQAANVATHTFYPFLKYDEGWTRFARKGFHGERKDRPIRFAARLDSCIFSYYRYLLSQPYEDQLNAERLTDSVIAYRRIPKSTGIGGKSNIEFALAATECVQNLKNCCSVALDISSFFENLDHSHLRATWAGLIGQSRLPPDHFKVFQSITQYAFINVQDAYERLGFYGIKKDRHGKERPGYLCARDEIPIKLCDGKTFREKIAWPTPDIIHVNKTGIGVPQGAPLSDLLANAYLLEFDKYVRDICEKIGGTYFRYSDDILIIAPISSDEAIALEADVRSAITDLGHGLIIKEKKSAIHQFVQDGTRQIVTVIKATGNDDKPTFNKPFEYLGFRYDGRQLYIRDKTMSNLHRKIASVSQAAAIRFVKRYSGKTATDILGRVNVEELIQAFGPVEDFKSKSDDYRSWTFTTYAKRASKAMGPLGKPILRQVSGLRHSIMERLERELVKLAG
ncbi:reverse transcriptase [Agrobacterium sp. B131/95]|nr:Reverse transcriptase (RNA-dependent DNA polymerase) [Rhizobium sp. AP16]OCJ25569.1 reverse transcriptase [Agrobacterium sp. B131/95]